MTELEDLIVESISRSAIEVFSTMLDAQIVLGPVTVENGAPESNDGVVSIIGLAGSWAGAGSVVCSPAMACRICSQMLMSDNGAVNDEVLDAIAELTNMIIGGVKTNLEPHLGPLGLSIPTVVYGRNFRTKGAGNAEWIVAPFAWDADHLLVKLCLAPSGRDRSPAHPLGQNYALEV